LITLSARGNRALTAITNTLSVPTGSFTQSAKVRQSNTINAEIAINNSGHLDADIIGINAVIADNAFGQTKLAEELAGQPTTSLLKQRLRPGKPWNCLGNASRERGTHGRVPGWVCDGGARGGQCCTDKPEHSAREPSIYEWSRRPHRWESAVAQAHLGVLSLG
jgi:hypothetical protein